MPDSTLVSTHYARGGLLAAITDGLARLGKTPESVTVDDLAPVDEFHIGGREATAAFLDRLELGAADHVLDAGCGLGGAARFAAGRYGCRVTGIDLTPDYVETGRTLCGWLGPSDRVVLGRGDALAVPFADATFDAAYMIHVGMNVADKEALAREFHRVLRPGGRLGIYDVMGAGGGTLRFPVPWASDARGNAVAPPAAYRDALQVAGFDLEAERDRRDFALDFFARVRATVSAAGGPPPLGLHLLMGDAAPEKVGNMIENINANRCAPVEMIARKPDRRS